MNSLNRLVSRGMQLYAIDLRVSFCARLLSCLKQSDVMVLCNPNQKFSWLLSLKIETALVIVIIIVDLVIVTPE